MKMQRIVPSSLKALPLLLMMLILTIAVAPAAAQDLQVPMGGGIDAPAVYAYSDHGNMFVHTVPEGVNSNHTIIDHPLLNGNPNAILFVTPLWENGDPATGLYVGVWYNGQYWTIFNQAGTEVPMEPGRKFIVQVHSPSESVFQVTQTEANEYILVLDHPLLNMMPNAKIQVTPTWTVNGVDTNVYNNHPVVTAFLDEGQWVIGNADEVPFEVGAGFNVQIVSAASNNTSFVHTANGGIFFSALSHPMLNNNPNARIMVTPIYTAYGVESSLSLNHFAVTYANDVWNIVNENANPIAVGTQFMVTVLNSFENPYNPIRNAGFEVAAADNNAVPGGWKSVGAVKRACNKLSKGKIVSYEQYCAAQIKGGNGSVSSLVQNIGDVSSFMAGNHLYMGARIMGKGVAAGVKIQAIVKLDDASTIRFKIPKSDLVGSYAYKVAFGKSAANLPANAVSAKLKIVHKGTGSLFVDAVYLSASNLAIVFNEGAQEAAEMDTVPLPAPAQ